mmetsp:Transcript_12500/g.24193  ORF Transcript_12500/g.24193 Transcript_12500/m.24193 type:complete len:130 (+) Transcript_12500:433-822(+)
MALTGGARIDGPPPRPQHAGQPPFTHVSGDVFTFNSATRAHPFSPPSATRPAQTSPPSSSRIGVLAPNRSKGAGTYPRVPDEPYPQVLDDDEPDFVITAYPQVPDDSKPPLADNQFTSSQATVLQAPMP